MCEIPPYLFIFFHLGPTKDTIPITHAEGWHRIHRLSTHTFLTSINRERSSHCKLTVRGAITLDLKKLQFQKMINSCTPTCLTQNYTLEWSIQAICCQSQKKACCEEKFVHGSYTWLELAVMWIEFTVIRPSVHNCNGGSQLSIISSSNK